MAIINLQDCFPTPEDLSKPRGPLPRQQEFLSKTLDPKGPKFIAYIGGIGSGKSLIGCITMLSQAVLYASEYLIGRQFLPELKVTTYKTFKDICPPELIIEDRVADMILKIKAVDGISTIYFRQLEEPDKFRSMNLGGFYIDEANQVSEEAFMLLQGRLRGKGLRKGIVTTNPRGHDYLFRWFFQKDHIKDEEIKKQYHLIKAPSTENVHLPDGYLQSVMASWDEARIKREIEGSFDAYEGMVFTEFRRDVHVVRPFAIPANWKRHIRIDPGYRNPCAVLFAAISPEGEVYVYREMYHREWLVEEIVCGNKKEGKLGILDYIKGDKRSFESCKIDPAAKRRSGKAGESDFDEYRRHWPDSLPPLLTAKNDVQVGLDRVKSYMKPDPKTGKPLLYIFDTCKNLLEEITTYRYPDLKPNQQGTKNEDEKPIKVDDHALDALRYLIVDLPERYKPIQDEIDRYKKFTNIEIAMQDEFRRLTGPRESKDPFGDGI